MSVFNEALEETNKKLAQLGQSYLDGNLERPDFRHQRRELICAVFGVSAPNVPPGHDGEVIKEDNTLPDAAAKPQAAPAQAQQSDDELVIDEMAEGEVAEQSESESESMKTSHLLLTALLVLLALAGIGGLLAFILR
jgi:hypothetical protein